MFKQFLLSLLATTISIVLDVDSSDAAIKDSIVNTNLEMARKIYEAKKKLNI
jgi:hypothetical protein